MCKIKKSTCQLSSTTSPEKIFQKVSMIHRRIKSTRRSEQKTIRALLDSGAQVDVTSLRTVREHGIPIKAMRKPVIIGSANGNENSTKLTASFGPNFEEVLVLDDADDNIVSLGKILDLGYNIIFLQNKQFLITSSDGKEGERMEEITDILGKSVFQSVGEDNLFYVEQEFLQRYHGGQGESATGCHKVSKIIRDPRISEEVVEAVMNFHRCNGHMSENAMVVLFDYGYVSLEVKKMQITGTIIRKIFAKRDCGACNLGSMNKLPHGLGTGIPVSTPGEVLGVDWVSVTVMENVEQEGGIIKKRVLSYQGNAGYFLIVCYATGHLLFLPYPNKGNYANAILVAIYYFKRHGWTTKVIMSDSEKLMNSNAVGTILGALGATNKHSPPGSQHRNRLERYVQIHVKRTSTITIDQDTLDPRHWDIHGAAGAQYHNRTPNFIGDGGIPILRVIRRYRLQPKVDFALPYGQIVGVRLDNNTESPRFWRFGPCSHIGVFVGPSETTGGVRILLPGRNRDLPMERERAHIVPLNLTTRELNKYLISRMKNRTVRISVFRFDSESCDLKTIPSDEPSPTNTDIHKLWTKWKSPESNPSLSGPLRGATDLESNDTMWLGREVFAVDNLGRVQASMLNNNQYWEESENGIRVVENPQKPQPREIEQDKIVLKITPCMPTGSFLQKRANDVNENAYEAPKNKNYANEANNVDEIADVAINDKNHANGANYLDENAIEATDDNNHNNEANDANENAETNDKVSEHEMNNENFTDFKEYNDDMYSDENEGRGKNMTFWTNHDNKMDDEDEQGSDAESTGFKGRNSPLKTRSGRQVKIPAEGTSRTKLVRLINDFKKIYKAKVAGDKQNPRWHTVIKGNNKEKWLASGLKELTVINDNNTFEIVEKKDIPLKYGNPLPARMICTIKRDGTYKCRLVVMGNYEKSDWYIDYYSPTANFTSFLFLISLAAQNGLVLGSTDITGAFLYAVLDEYVYIVLEDCVEIKKMLRILGYTIPDNKPIYWKLLKSLYGLKIAPQKFNQHISSHLIEKGYDQCINDPCLFKKLDDNGKATYLLIHVDDTLMVATDETLVLEAKDKLREAYVITEDNDVSQFIGITIDRDLMGNIQLSQLDLLNRILDEFDPLNDLPMRERPTRSVRSDYIDASKPVDKDKYRSLLGSLMFMMRTRFDINFAISYAASKTEYATTYDYEGLLWILGYLKATKDIKCTYRIDLEKSARIPKCIHPNDVVLEAYCDASFNAYKDSKSHSGYFIRFKGTGSAPVTCTSQKQKLVAVSVCQAELEAVFELTKTLVYSRNLSEELGFKQEAATEVYEDNTCVITLSNAYAHKQKRVKHFLLRINYIGELTKNKIILVKYVPSEKQLADCLTKHVQSPNHRFLFRSLMGLDTKNDMINDEDEILLSELTEEDNKIDDNEDNTGSFAEENSNVQTMKGYSALAARIVQEMRYEEIIDPTDEERCNNNVYICR